MIVSTLDLRREGPHVFATLVCHCCAGAGRVLDQSVPRRYFVDYADLSNHPSLPCEPCGETGKRRLESTHPDFAACWRASVYHLGLTKAERDERDDAAAQLAALEAEATDAAVRGPESWPYECSQCAKAHDAKLSIGCVACGGELRVRRSSVPASLSEALDRIASRLPSLSESVRKDVA